MINNALLCVFDISEQSQPNVFIEVGYAYGKGKSVILTSKTQPPSNLAGYDTIIYSSFKELTEKLVYYLPAVVDKAILSKAKPEDTIPAPIIDIIYRNWQYGKDTKKSEIYKLMAESSADPMLQSFAESGEFQIKDDSVILTSRGVEIFKTLFAEKGRGIVYDIIAVLKKLRGLGEESSPRNVAKELNVSERIVFEHLKNMHDDLLVTYRTSGKEPDLDTKFILCEKAFEPPFN